MMISNVISRLANVVVELSAIAKIRNYKKLHERHHFIPMAMEVHGAPKCDTNCFIKECACLFHDRQLKSHLYLSFYIQFFNQRVNIVIQHVLACAIERKIMLTGNACSRLPFTIKSHDLHACDIRRAMGEIASYHKRD
jgi:hypothetical protein